MDINKNIEKFKEGDGKNGGRRLNERYASFDFCYNYFYSFYKKDRIHELANSENLEKSCLQLGFYLASWGMMRGSSFLLEKSVRNYSNLIILISKMPSKMWEIDVDQYNPNNLELLLNCKKKIIDILGKNNKPSDTLVTKIMLGVFANVPAYDGYFKKFLKSQKYSQTFNKRSLLEIKSFYEENRKIFNSIKIYTLDFFSGNKMNIIYKKAKLIDMHGFIEGFYKL